MQKNIKWSIIGGDDRFAKIAETFSAKEENIKTAYLPDIAGIESTNFADAVAGSEIIILPLPAAVDGSHINVNETYLQKNHLELTQIPTLYELLIKLRRGQIILGGILPAWFIRRCEENGVKAIDYFAEEQLTIMNVIPTVEGCIGLLIANLPTTLHGMKILITGYGRIGKVLCSYLKHMGANIICAARKSADFAWMELNTINHTDYESLSGMMGEFDAVVNTVPTLVITEQLLRKSKPDCLFIDLASKPGGIDYEAAKRLGTRTMHALSLPGKTAPISAAGYILDTILHLVEQV